MIAPAGAFAVALFLFVAINAILAWTQPFAADPFAYPIRTWSWWTTDTLRHDDAPINLAVLGSSLTVTALSESDAGYLGKKLDMASYRSAKFLDAQLSSKIGGNFRSLNLSSPGQMPSDAYLTLKTALALGKRPDVIVYGLAPRDFFDGTLADATQTEAFKVLERVVDATDCAQELASSPWSRLAQAAKERLYLLRLATDLQMWAQRLGERVLLAAGLSAPQKSEFQWTWKERCKLLPFYHPMEVIPGMMLADNHATFLPHGVPPLDLASYRSRYRNPDFKIYAQQMHFVERLIALCHKENISIILVNMPIRQCNIDLLPPAMHAQYLSDLSAIAARRSVAFFNLCGSGDYKDEDYRDSVHLNATGGRKFVNQLVQMVAANDKTLAQLKLASTKLKNAAIAGLKSTTAKTGM
ncbi:MAG TPA: hypothetical protein V6D17_08320 [Candidatus Obscuribacterales bacterium]